MNSTKVKPKKIYNHDIMTCTHEKVIGNHLYSGRVLGMTEPEDIIQLHPDLQCQWSAIREHYARVNLSHSQNVVWDISRQKMAEYPDHEVSVFIFGDVVHPNSPEQEWFKNQNEDWFRVVQYMNSKNDFMELAEELEVPAPKTICFQSKKDIEDFTRLPYPCYSKPAVSVDGVGISRCADAEELQQALELLDETIPIQIQEEVTATNFLNLQYQASAKGVERLAASEQILDGYTHIGNRYPTAHQPWEIVEPMAQWMYEKGMKEIFAFDVAVVEEEETPPRYLAIECNPRFNGASYPTGIARKLNIAGWASENFTTQYRSLADINLQGLEFDQASGTGVVVVNWGSILVGKIAVLLAGSVEQQLQLRDALKERL